MDLREVRQPPWVRSATAPQLAGSFSGGSELSRRVRVGHHMGRKLSYSCPCPEVPSTPGKGQTGPGVAAKRDHNTVVFMESLAVHKVAPSPRPC